MWRESLGDDHDDDEHDNGDHDDDDHDDDEHDDGDDEHDDGDGPYLCLLMELYHLPRKNIPNARVEPYLQEFEWEDTEDDLRKNGMRINGRRKRGWKWKWRICQKREENERI